MEPKRQLTEEEAEQVADLEVGQELELADGVTVRMTEEEFPACEGCALNGTDVCTDFECICRKPVIVEE